MNLKNYIAKINDFFIKRVIEVFGLFLVVFSFLLMASFVTYSPEDPNFINNVEVEINNILGFRGSYISDFFIQSFGLISFLIPITFFFKGIKIFKTKDLLSTINSLFFCVLYTTVGTVFSSIFYQDSFWLNNYGNGGFVGSYLTGIELASFLINDFKFSYYLYVLILLIFFFISIDINLKSFVSLIKILKKLITKHSNEKFIAKENKDTNIENDDKVYENERIQKDLPFNEVRIYEKNKLKFILPKIDNLNLPHKKETKKNYDEKSDILNLEKILLDFGVEGKIKKVNYGPVVTLNEFEPAAGVKVSKIINLSEDIARNTSSESARISIIPGSSTVGIELPNSERENVYLREIISNQNFSRKEYKLPIALGKSISGLPIIGDLSVMPHLLIAGTTGSGKSVCINTIILSLLYKHSPDKCKFILIDPKMLELSTYEGIPHLLCPVITEPKKATSVLGWVVKEMENRYKLMTKEGVRNIDGYNAKHKVSMPFIVVVVDEMSDLMHVAGKEIENYIQKLSQMARASGIHIIMATQRPSVDVITGTIKANFPTRISFQVSSKIDSRTILGEQGAEQLLGKGDMLYMSSANRIVRIHAPFVSDDEIEKVNNFVRSQAEPDYVNEIINFSHEEDINVSIDQNENQDDLYETALEIVKLEGKASTSFLQRKLQIGYNRAARIIDMMEEKGIVSKANHVGKREVLK